MRLTLKIANKIRIYESPIVMGIVNCTPDSFYEGSRKQTEIEILSEVEKHLSEGATLIDLGAYSTRPGVQAVSLDEEKKRLANPLKWIHQHFPEAIISVDTFRSEVAEFSLANGAHIINDISAGGFDEKTLDVVSNYQCPYIAMHLEGTLESMHQTPQREDVVQDVINYFQQKIQLFQQKGIEQIIIDPGFGFSKTMDDNFQLLHHLDALQSLSYPILTGVSRKRMVWQTLHSSPKEALNGTSVLNTIALMKGSSILRVHDVKEATEAIRLIYR